MSLLAVLVVGASFQQMTAASPGAPVAQGEIVTPCALPFTETLRQMADRDARVRAQIQALGGGAAPSVRAVPLGVPEAPRSAPEDGAERSFAPPQGPGDAGGNPPQTIGTNFKAINLQDQFSAFASGSFPPDTNGAIGPSHFVEIINSSVAIYNRTGTRLSHVSLDSFFTVGVHPLNGSFDPRVLYDRRSGHWFAIVLEFGNPVQVDNGAILAVSRTSDPTGAWDKYFLDIGTPTAGPTFFTDFETLGTDDNGVYAAATIFSSSGGGSAKIVATPKASLIAAVPSLGAVTAFSNITDMYSTPQPAHNQSAAAATDRAWFVASSTGPFANVNYRTLTWSGGVPTLSATSVLTTPTYAPPINAAANGSTTNVNVGDDRLQMAVIRNNRLWTCRNVGVNSTGGNTGADRTGCEWLELNVTAATATLVQSGRVFDNAAGPRFYYYPSIMVNSAGDAAMGFSGSRSTEFIAAYTCGRLVSDSLGTMQSVAQVQAGLGAYTRNDNLGRNRWGDYSYTSLDPNDELTFWTIQEYAEAPNANGSIWGTVVAQLQGSAFTLSPSKLSVTVGGSLSVAFTAPAGRPFNDWIGLFKVGDPNTAQQAWWKPTGGATSGTFNVQTPSVAGNYEFRYFQNGTRNPPVAVSATVTVAAPGAGGSPDFTLTPSPASVAAGSNLTISWTAPAARASNDWVGLFKTTDSNTGPRVFWNFTGGAAAGSFTLTAPETGSYEFRYLLEGGFTDVKRAAITVTAPTGAGYGLFPSTSSVTTGGALSVTWTAPGAHSPQDWIVLCKVGDPNTGYVWWDFTGPGDGGTKNLTAPLTPGDYEFRYLLNYGFTDVVRSAPVTVTAPASSNYTLTPSTTSVAALGSLSISWTAPANSAQLDWIGLFKVGDPNTAKSWFQYTGGATSGTFNLSAPINPGQYEFRYLLNNGLSDTKRSVTVTVN